MPHTPDATLMFTDVVGSTELLDRLGDERGGALLRHHLDILRGAAARHRGQVIKSLGDGLMLTFPNAQSAAACAAAMQRDVLSHRVDAADAGGLQMRIGIHHGPVVRDGDDYFGRHVVIASRLCDSCPAGEVLISAEVRELLCPETAPCRDAGALNLRGITQPVQTAELHWQVTAESDGTDARGAYRVGRFPLTRIRSGIQIRTVTNSRTRIAVPV